MLPVELNETTARFNEDKLSSRCGETTCSLKLIAWSTFGKGSDFKIHFHFLKKNLQVYFSYYSDLAVYLRLQRTPHILQEVPI